MIASYCRPIKDAKGTYVGTLSVDVSMEWISQTISAVKPYPNSYSIMIGAGGTFFVHPDTTKLLHETIFTPTLEKPDTALTALGHAMQRGETGMRHLRIIFNRVISRELKPLKALAVQAETIAAGQFYKKFPKARRVDEIGKLNHSFINMRLSLVKYINELKRNTATWFMGWH